MLGHGRHRSEQSEVRLEAKLLRFQGVVGYSTGDEEEATHFFEHTLGLQLGADDAGMRLYALSEDVTLTVDVSGGMAGQPPYLVFSSPRVVEAAEHFLQRGCQVRELPWAAAGTGFFARSPEGHTVAVVDEAAFESEE